MAGSHTAQLNAIIDELPAPGLVDLKFRSAKGNQVVCKDMKALAAQLQSVPCCLWPCSSAGRPWRWARSAPAWAP